MNLKLFGRLAIDNMMKNKRTMLPYMFAGILSVLMHFVIRSMAFNDYIYNYETGIEAFAGAQMVAIIMEMCSGIIAFFSILFLLYANQFIMKRRKKELGLYGILGLTKYHIAIVMVLETALVMGIVILSGLALGIFLNKIMLLLLYKILNQPPVAGFFLNFDVVKNTFVLFVIIYLVILIYNIFQVNVSQPIELLRSEQSGEKEPKVKWGIFLCGVVELAVGYGMALSCKNTAEAFSTLFVSVLLVISATYSLFMSGSIFLLKQLKKNKKFYYKVKNFVSVSGLIYRMKHNAAGLAGICVLSTGVILLMTCGVSLYMLGEDNINQMYPKDICFVVSNPSDVNMEEINTIISTKAEESRIEIKDAFSCEYYETVAYRENNYLEYNEKFSSLDDFCDLYMITRDEYNRITGKDLILNDGEILAYQDGKEYSEYLLSSKKYTVVGEADKEILNNIQDSSMSLFEKVFLVVPDKEDTKAIYEGADEVNITDPDAALQCYGYDIKNPENMDAAKGFVDAVQQEIVPKGYGIYSTIKEEIRAYFYGLYGGAFFVGIFLSIFFLVATVLIIYYKQISEGYEDQKRYEILEKVGMTEKEIKATIKSQVMLMFFLPVGTAIIHMLAATKIIRMFLAFAIVINETTFLIGIVITSVVFLAVYALVYRLTSREYYKIVYKGI